MIEGSQLANSIRLVTIRKCANLIEPARRFCLARPGQEIGYRRFPNLIEQAELRTDILLVA